MQNPLNIAIELAKEVGAVQKEALGKDHKVDFKGEIDIVTDVDKRSEAIIVERIQKDFPDHDIMAEEGTGNRKEGNYRWIVDPLDGTVNFNHAYPHFGPSIALEYRGELILGVVYEPNRDELFVAEKGSGAELNGNRIQVSEVANLNHSLLATGFPYNIREGDGPTNIDHFNNFLTKTQALRRDGMAAGQFCDLACGRFDGIWQFLLKPWDIAAGTIIVKEAGGKVTNADGSDINIYGEGFVASNVLLHDAILNVLKSG